MPERTRPPVELPVDVRLRRELRTLGHAGIVLERGLRVLLMDEILVAIDLGPSSASVLSAAASLAARLRARLHVVHVAPPDPDFVGYDAGPPSVREGVAEDLREEHGRLDAAVRDVRGRGIDARGRLLRGPTVDTIVAEADRVGADVIVVGCHARGALLEALVGSTSRELLHDSGRPVLVVPRARE